MKLLLAIGTLLFTSTAQAATFVDNRDALQANDTVDWSVLGSTFTGVSNPFVTTSSAGLDLNASIPTGSFLRIDQTPVLPGAYNVGDALLFTGMNNPGALTITFDTPVYGAGTQIQSDPANIPNYTATITAFDRARSQFGQL